MEFFESFAAVPALVLIVYLAAEGLKLIKNGVLKKYIPVFCGVFGGVLGVVAYILVPEFIMADNYFTAIAIGIVSGFSATGIHQTFKQISKGDA